MDNPNKFFAKNVVTHVALATMLLACSACGAGDANTGKKQLSKLTELSELKSEVSIDARLRHWTDKELTVDYVFHNQSNADLIVMTGKGFNLQTALLSDGKLRLFQGKQETPNTDFFTAPIIAGQQLSASTSLNYSGTVQVPIQLVYGNNREELIDPAIDTFEFCVGYGLKSELEPTRVTDLQYPNDLSGQWYPFNTGLELQQLACTDLKRPVASTTSGVSSLDTEHWEAALSGVFEVLNDIGLTRAQSYGLSLRVPDNSPERVDVTSFSLSDGSGGTQTRVSCSAGGFYNVTETGSASAPVTIDANDCVIGEDIVDGQVTRTTVLKDKDESSVVSMEFRDFRVTTGSNAAQISSGIYEYEEAHPISVDFMRGANFEVTTGTNTVTVTNLDAEDTSFFGTAFDRDLSANFTVIAPWTLNKPLNVTMPRRLGGVVVGGSGNAFGLLVLAAEQGDRVTIDMDPGQGDLALITLEHAGAVTTEYRQVETLLGQR